MYMSFKQETVDRFKKFTDYNTGWKLPLVYLQIKALQYVGENKIEASWKAFGIEPVIEVFDWNDDISPDEDPKEKFGYAKVLILQQILEEMLKDPGDSSYSQQWEKMLGI